MAIRFNITNAQAFGQGPLATEKHLLTDFGFTWPGTSHAGT
jgi:hypothetical protein